MKFLLMATVDGSTWHWRRHRGAKVVLDEEALDNSFGLLGEARSVKYTGQCNHHPTTGDMITVLPLQQQGKGRNENRLHTYGSGGASQGAGRVVWCCAPVLGPMVRKTNSGMRMPAQ